MNTLGTLAGIRVIDMTRVIAGPYAAKILGDLSLDLTFSGQSIQVHRLGNTG